MKRPFERATKATAKSKPIPKAVLALVILTAFFTAGTQVWAAEGQTTAAQATGTALTKSEYTARALSEAEWPLD